MKHRWLAATIAAILSVLVMASAGHAYTNVTYAKLHPLKQSRWLYSSTTSHYGAKMNWVSNYVNHHAALVNGSSGSIVASAKSQGGPVEYFSSTRRTNTMAACKWTHPTPDLGTLDVTCTAIR